eukprot:121600_1
MGNVQTIFGSYVDNTEEKRVVDANQHPKKPPKKPPLLPQMFKQKYYAYAPTYWRSENRCMLHCCNKVVLPESTLNTLVAMNMIMNENPMYFQIESVKTGKKTHCSVLEFTAPENSIYIPFTIIESLGIDPHGDDMVRLTNVSLPKGWLLTLRPHETEFLMRGHRGVRIILWKALRNISCVTEGDIICFEFCMHEYKLDVVEVKPKSYSLSNAAISIFDVDIGIDMQQALDYKQETEEMEEMEEMDEDVDAFGNSFGAMFKTKSQLKSEHFQSLRDSGDHGKKMAMTQQNIENKEKCLWKKEEEVVGIMRYIYKTNGNGNSELIKRKLIKNVKLTKGSAGKPLPYIQDWYVGGAYLLGQNLSNFEDDPKETNDEIKIENDEKKNR